MGLPNVGSITDRNDRSTEKQCHEKHEVIKKIAHSIA